MGSQSPEISMFLASWGVDVQKLRGSEQERQGERERERDKGQILGQSCALKFRMSCRMHSVMAACLDTAGSHMVD